MTLNKMLAARYQQKILVMWLLHDIVKAHLLVREAVFGDLVTCKTSLDNPRTLKKRDKTFRPITTCWSCSALFSKQHVFEWEREVIRHSLKPPAVTRQAARRNTVSQNTSVSTATLYWPIKISKADTKLKQPALCKSMFLLHSFIFSSYI